MHACLIELKHFVSSDIRPGVLFFASEFEVNVVIVLQDDHLITENFRSKL